MSNQNNSKLWKNAFYWILGITVVLLMLGSLRNNEQGEKAREVSYTELMSAVKDKKVKSAVVPENGTGVVIAKLGDGNVWKVNSPNDLWMITDMKAAGVDVYVKPADKPSVLWTIFTIFGPMLLFIGVWYYFMTKMQGGGGGGAKGLFNVSNNPAKEASPEKSTVRFVDVAGCDEAKLEVQELVDFLKEPARFQSVGGKIPKGVLLVGPPGTGKTMMAKAIAGEAGVPFFSVSGSDFVQMFVGVGAARVRSMFEEARKKSPCIIYIDEIDAVGKQRSAGGFGGNDEREQTLNQILVEMDGFGGDTNIIVLASTNRVEILDDALLRPGRFDRQVVVPKPDVVGREQILRVHTAKIPLGPDVRLDVLARQTPGYAGADLANLVNEAALMAARHRERLVTMPHFELAADKILMGPERKSMKMSEEERRTTAYHEAGHAALMIIKGNDPVHKVSIVPRGRALGVTMQLPQEDRYCLSREHWIAEIENLMGGRAAEEVFCHKITTGASNDMVRATAIARKMVTDWGMSEKLGPLHYGDNEGRGASTFGPEVQRTIDSEIRSIIENAYANAVQLLKDYRESVEKMTAMLLDKETIDAHEVEGCFPEDIQKRARAKWKTKSIPSTLVAQDTPATGASEPIPSGEPAAQAS
jgi:cell division protease FtsH